MTLEMAIWANRLLYVGGVFAPLLTVLVLSKLCSIRLPRWTLWGLLSYSSVVLGLVFTTGKTGLYYTHMELGYGDGFRFLNRTYGPLHVLYPIMMMLYAIIMVVYLVLALRKRNQISLRLVATISVTSFAIFIMYLVERILKTDVNFLSVGYLVGIIFMNKYFERVKMYDMSTNVSGSLERMKEYGYVVFDNEFCYVNSNKFIKRLFPEIGEWRIDKKVPCAETYFYREVMEYLYRWNEQVQEKKYVSVEERYFELDIRRLSYGKRRDVGYLLEFVDRTIEKKYYNTIEEYNTLMEHEVEKKTEELLAQ